MMRRERQSQPANRAEILLLNNKTTSISLSFLSLSAAFCTQPENAEVWEKGRGAVPYLRPRVTGPASPAVGVAAPHGWDGVSGGDAEPYRLFCTVAASRQRWQPAGLNSFDSLFVW